jgi:antitoxin MazE
MRVAKWGNCRRRSSKRSGFQEGDEIEITVAGTRRFEIERDDSPAKPLARLKALRRSLPKGFRFDRDEANER